MPVPESRLTATADIRRIVQGEDIVITAELFDEVTSQVVDLEGATAVVVQMPGTSATVELTLGAGVTLSSDPGRLLVALNASQTADLLVGEDLDWQITVTLADASVRIVQLVDALEVVASLF